MHRGQKHTSDLGQTYARWAETYLRFKADLYTGCKNMPQIWGRLMHGVQKHASDSRQTYARGAKTCLRFKADFCPPCIIFSQFLGGFSSFCGGINQKWLSQILFSREAKLREFRFTRGRRRRRRWRCRGSTVGGYTPWHRRGSPEGFGNGCRHGCSCHRPPRSCPRHRPPHAD